MADTQTKLIKAAQRGDVSAFQQLYDQYSGRVFAISLRLCGDRGRAEEATQEAFLKVWQQLPGFAFKSAFGTWLHSIATRTAIDVWRKTPAVLVGEDQLPERSHLPELDHGLDQLIARLPAQAKAVFVLVAVEGHTHNEVAALLNIAEGSSKAQYFRARSLLKEWLNDSEH